MHTHMHAHVQTQHKPRKNKRERESNIYKAVGGFGYFCVYTALRMFDLIKGEGIISTGRLCNICYLGSRAGPSIWVLALCPSLLLM